jgi:trehalose-6-phosphate synthase
MNNSYTLSDITINDSLSHYIHYSFPLHNVFMHLTTKKHLHIIFKSLFADIVNFHTELSSYWYTDFC